MNKKTTNENIFGAAKKFTDAFFDGLKSNASNQIIKKAESAKLPPDAVKMMKDIEERSNKLRDLIKSL
jgi:hypothetical protein